MSGAAWKKSWRRLKGAELKIIWVASFKDIPVRHQNDDIADCFKKI